MCFSNDNELEAVNQIELTWNLSAFETHFSMHSPNPSDARLLYVVRQTGTKSLIYCPYPSDVGCAFFIFYNQSIFRPNPHQKFIYKRLDDSHTTMDTTCNVKRLNRFCNKHKREITRIAGDVNFDQSQLRALIIIYVKLLDELGASAKQITSTQFRSIFHRMLDMPDNFLVDRIIIAVGSYNQHFVSLTTFVKTFSVFLVGTFNERCCFCFKVYDHVGDRMIRREHLTALIKRSIFLEEEDDAAKDIVETMMKRMDRDLDGSISFRDYIDTIKEHPELMQCYGQCLPERFAVYAFMMTFSANLPKY